MIDRFKFRVWDTNWLRMKYQGFTINPTTGKVHWTDETWLEEETDQLIPMQSTGLKDSKGTLIYEEDIVKLKRKAGFGTSSGQTEVVQWDNRKCRYTIGSSDLTDTKHLVVIGNIYENPNLKH